MSYESENKELLKTVLDSTFFRDFSTPHDGKEKLFGSLELQLTSKCNLKCSYCYYSEASGNGIELNPHAPWELLQSNARLIFDWLNDNDYTPKQIDIFSGDSLIHFNSYKIIEMAVDFYINKGVRGCVVIPSNMTFIKQSRLVEMIEKIITKAKEHDVFVGVSASIDGKFADKITRRPVKEDNIDDFYDDEYYEKVFAFCKKHRCGFHPMVSYENIDSWWDNFMWFQTMMKKYDIGWNNIYLLEVRNDGWTDETIRKYGEFYRKVLDFTYDMVGNKEAYVHNFVLTMNPDHKISNMNLFNNLSIIGRGIGCSLQTTLFVKLRDLTCNSCHRLSYDGLNGFKFVIENDKIVDIEPLNLAFYMATLSYEQKSAPYCENCLLKHICSGGCIGAQLESTGDAFVPIPSVCALEHMKVKTQYEFFTDKGILEPLLNYFSKDTSTSFKEIGRVYNG